MTATRRIAQPIRGRSLRRVLWKRLHLPRRLVHGALRAAKRAASPGQVALRRRLAAEVAEAGGVLAISPALGFRTLAAGELPGSEEAAARCRALHARALRSGSTARPVNPRKGFLLATATASELAGDPDLLRFLVSRPLLDAATAYLGTVPLLAGAVLWWTPAAAPASAAQAPERSQLFHFDAEDDRQLKLLLNVTTTGDDQGPFTLLPADRSERARSEGRARRRFSDAEALGAGASESAVRLVGPPGSGGLVDTSRCLHQGSRAVREDRLVLMAQFLPFDCPTESTYRVEVAPGQVFPEADPIQKLALGVE